MSEWHHLPCLRALELSTCLKMRASTALAPSWLQLSSALPAPVTPADPMPCERSRWACVTSTWALKQQHSQLMSYTKGASENCPDHALNMIVQARGLEQQDGA